MIPRHGRQGSEAWHVVVVVFVVVVFVVVVFVVALFVVVVVVVFFLECFEPHALLPDMEE